MLPHALLRNDSLLGDFTRGSEGDSMPEAIEAKDALEDLILQETQACDQLTEYMEYWQAQLQRRSFLVRLEFTTPWNPAGITTTQIKTNHRKVADMLTERLRRLGGELHQHNIQASKLKDDTAYIWTSKAWNLIHQTIGGFDERKERKRSARAKAKKRSNGDHNENPLMLEGKRRKLPLEDTLYYLPGFRTLIPPSTPKARIHARKLSLEMRAELGDAAPPVWWSWRTRKFLLLPYNLVCVPALLAAGYFALTRRKRVLGLTLTSLKSIGQFMYTHIYEPTKAIIDEIFFRHNVPHIDREALEMSRESLRKMLKSYFDEKFPNLPEQQRTEMANKMDMKAVSEEYSDLVNYAVTNTLRGDIPRLALIRMQFVEKEMLSMMDAVEMLLDKNEVNMQFTATVPALVLLYFSYYLLKLLIRRLTGRSSRTALSAKMRKEILRLDRLLNLKDYDDVKIQPHVRLGRLLSEEKLASKELNPVDMGRAVVIVHRLRKHLKERAGEVEPDEYEAISTDLKEILGELGPVTVRQQLAIIRRMRLSYGLFSYK
ncbi:hypothetical protein AAMO2058_000312000 [Amorphochlora amoebiformis]|uniref:Uncharacterized protein n=1 Tax=Amorphochlora amoebiformis TaxID=1561963 RepID=A0A7S0D8G8_9EUKA|mmetsp:Transcript_21565/g.34062  ORF Transcript_21565/g.34062 Transcript_21565/m.34062 type:complete len:544 (+) Transcript_21565:37-1668(+)